MELYKLTPEEMMIIELLFLASLENNKQLLLKYSTLPITRHPLPIVLTSLQNKGIILKSFIIPEKITGEFDFETIPFNNIFLNRYKKASGQLGIELFKHYPNEALIGGVVTPLRNWAKYFKSEEDMCFQYGKSIGWKYENHKKVLDLIEWSKQNGGFGLNMNLGAFIISKMWISIEEFKNGDKNMLTYDATISI